MYICKHFQPTLEGFGTICVYKNPMPKRKLWVLEKKEKFATPTLQTTLRMGASSRRNDVWDRFIGQV